jgi:hypothetical protein
MNLLKILVYERIMIFWVRHLELGKIYTYNFYVGSRIVVDKIYLGRVIAEKGKYP